MAELLTGLRRSVLIACFLVVLAVIYLIGFSVHIYDKSNKYIGKYFVFSEPVLLLSELPDNYAGKFIANHYDMYITSEKHWNIGARNDRKIRVQELDESIVYRVKDAFSRRSYGFLAASLSSMSRQYFVIDLGKGMEAVIGRNQYEKISKICNDGGVLQIHPGGFTECDGRFAD